MGKEIKKANDKPVANFRDFPVTASVWKKTIKADKKSFVVYNTTLQCTYKDDEGEYQNTSNFKEQDLLRVSQVALKTYNWILNQKEKDYKESKGKEEETEDDEE
jgi:hypothetical protein